MPRRAAASTLSTLPHDPGVYMFRDGAGAPLYVGKSVSLRTRARSHFTAAAASARVDRAGRAASTTRSTESELGALVLENRLIKALAPARQRARSSATDGFAYLRCRLDIAFPILEVAREPAPGHAVNVGPLRGPARDRRAGRAAQLAVPAAPLRPHAAHPPVRPSAYGQMGRCLSPCLGDLDPNAYRRRLDEALALFTGAGEGGARLLEHVDEQMRAAARDAALRARGVAAAPPRAAGGPARTPRRRAARDPRALAARARAAPARRAPLRRLLARRRARRRLGRAARPRRAAPSARGRRCHGAGGRVGDPSSGAFVPPDEVDEVRIVAGWLAAHEDVPVLDLDDEPAPDALAGFVTSARAAA